MSASAHILILFAVLSAQNLWGQSLIKIPDTLSGSQIVLTIQDSVTEFFPGFSTATIGYNGSYLGPTVILHQGDSVTFVVHNRLTDTTTTHWHGLHVAPINDGGPHNIILPGHTWMPHFTVMDKAATYWYHPHPHGKTMAQIVKGAAGLIIIRDAEEAALSLPRSYGVDDIPLIFQFETFDTVTRQIVANDDADNAVLVNGTINGMVNLPAQWVRLRLLNASSLRFFRFGFWDSRLFFQIATDNGLLDAPVPLTRLDLSPGERAEILADFTGQQGDTLFLKTYGSEFPNGYPGGPAIMGMMRGPLDNVDFTVLQINVTAPTAHPVTTIPSALTSNAVWPQANAAFRYVEFTAQPMMSMNFFINNAQFDMEVINFTVRQESVEIWNIENRTFVAHPFHIHGNHFYILEKNGFLPPPNEQGRKDVVLVPAMSGIKIITKYADFSDTLMPYMFHCHLLSHEDEGMMGQFIVRPPDPLLLSAVTTDVSCTSDGSIELSVSGGVAPYFFHWSTGDTTQSLRGLAPGTYSVTVNDSYNSTAEYFYSVREAWFDVGSISGDANPPAGSLANYAVADSPGYIYHWSVINGQILSGQGSSEVLVQWDVAGQSTISVIATSGSCSDTASLTIIISSSPAISGAEEVRIFPNPSNGTFILKIKTCLPEETQMHVINMFGQVVYSSFPEIVSGEGSLFVELKNACGGIYFVKFRMGEKDVIKKITLWN